MPNAESIIADIEKEYWGIYSFINGIIETASKQPLEDKEGRTVFERALGFQIFMEAKQFELQTFAGADYYERASHKVSTILDRLRSTKTMKVFRAKYVEGLSEGTHYTDDIEGLSCEAKQLFELCKKTDGTRSRQLSSLKGMLELLSDMEPTLVELYYDLRLIAGLITFPIGQRMEIKDKLIREGFADTANYLETAEEHMLSTPPRPKDTLSNCRLAVEDMIVTILKMKSLAPLKKFSNDLSTLSVRFPELIDNATKQLVQATYSYLSLKGSHTYSKLDQKDISEVEFGVEQTYRLLSHILVKLESGYLGPQDP